MALFDLLPGLISSIFLAILLSYYLLFFFKAPKYPKEKDFKSITIIIPAHNEERHLDQAIASVLSARFSGLKQIIVVNDGSTDNTQKIAEQYRAQAITILNTSHVGKSAAMNIALKEATGDAIAIIDGDSVIAPNALEEMIKELEKQKIAAVCGVVRVHNRDHWFGMFSQVEQLYNSLIRKLLTNVGANIITPGPLSMYRKDALKEIGGFSTKGFSEDIDVTVRLIRAGYRVGMSTTSIAETNMPTKPKEFLRQRFRFARGAINLFKQHLRLSKHLIDLYTFPLFLFGYLQAVIMGLITLYNIINGYYWYFIVKSEHFTYGALKYFIDWFTITGFSKWALRLFSGQEPWHYLAIIGVVATILSYFLYLYAIYKFDKRFDLLHLFPLFFMPLFWLLIMIVYVLSIPEVFRREQYNKWKKNE